jgi:hypothetical protein
MKTVKFILAIIGLSLVSLLVWMVASGWLQSALHVVVADTPDQASAIQVIGAGAIVILINTVVLGYLVLRSSWHGWKLALVVFLVYFGVYSFLSNIEAFAFNNALDIPANLLWMTLLTSLIMSLVFSPLAVWWLGKWRPDAAAKGSTELGDGIKTNQFLVKLAVLAALVYPLLYFGFGYYVAWQNPEVRFLYTGSTDILPFISQTWTSITATPWLYPLQILRAFIWIGLAVLVMRSSKANWVETSIIVGLNFALLMNAQHLLPNPYMPDSVRLSHFIETASSNFIWGCVIVWVLHRPHTSLADLLSGDPQKRKRHRGHAAVTPVH